MNGWVIGILFVLIMGFGVGPDEYQNEKLIEKELCKQQPRPEWCEHVDK